MAQLGLVHCVLSLHGLPFVGSLAFLATSTLHPRPQKQLTLDPVVQFHKGGHAGGEVGPTVGTQVQDG